MSIVTNDNQKKAIRAYMADHGVNYTTARRAILGGTKQPANNAWAYTHHTFTDPAVLKVVRRAYRAPRIKPYFQDMGDTGWDGEPWEKDTLRDFPFLRGIDTGDTRHHLRYADPYDIMSDTIRAAYMDHAAWESERAGNPLPDEHTREGFYARIGHVPESVENPIYDIEELLEAGRISIGEFTTRCEAHLKKWPGSIQCWEALAGLYWRIAEEDNLWSEPFNAAEKTAAIEDAQRCYETGVALAEKSLPKNTNALIMWGWLDNRPFLRCLHGLLLCHYRNGNTEEATSIATDILWLNPNDNQGIRYILAGLLHGVPWDEAKNSDW